MKTKLTPKERQSKIRQIMREYDRKKAELGSRAPSLPKGPAFTVIVVAVLLMLGGAIVQLAGGGGAGGVGVDKKTAQARRSVDALAEACGRFRYHCGVWPSAEEGVVALAAKSSKHAGWMGPYANINIGRTNIKRWREIEFDPWKRPYVYEPPADLTNGVPVLLSLGADGERGTADDVVPDPALFTKPLEDTSWAENWVPFYKRGIIVKPSRPMVQVGSGGK